MLSAALIGSKSQQDYDFHGIVKWKDDMIRYEYGTTGYARFAGWLKALTLVETLGQEAVFSLIAEKALFFKQALTERFGEIVVTPMDPESSSGILTIEPGTDNGFELSDFLWKEGKIRISSLDHTWRVRICSHIVNTPEEQKRFIELLSIYVQRKKA